MVNGVFFSIVVPSYNRANLIAKTIESVLSQSFKDFELIIVDDGSTDDTAAVVAEFTDTRIHYHKKENAERGAARNFGSRLAVGRYITFHDSDDLFYPLHLQTAYEFIVQNNYPEIFHTGYEIVDSKGRQLKRMSGYDENINEILFKKGNVLSCMCVFLKQEVALKYPFIEDRDLAGSEDAVLWLQLAAVYKWRSCDKVTAALINHDERSVTNINSAKLIKRLQLYEKYVTTDNAIQKQYGHMLKYVRLEAASYAALHLALAGDGSKAFAFWKRAVRLRGSYLLSKRSINTLMRIIF